MRTRARTTPPNRFALVFVTTLCVAAALAAATLCAAHGGLLSLPPDTRAALDLVAVAVLVISVLGCRAVVRSEREHRADLRKLHAAFERAEQTAATRTTLEAPRPAA